MSGIIKDIDKALEKENISQLKINSITKCVCHYCKVDECDVKSALYAMAESYGVKITITKCAHFIGDHE